MKYVTGTPSLEESCGLWKADLQEPDLEDGEYFSAYESLCEHLELRYPRGEWPPDLYVRGDCFGDKTQYVYFYRPEVMTVEFLSFLQQWLRTYGKNAWRILIATEIGNAESVMVYPNAVRSGRQYEQDLAGSLALFVQRMRELDQESDHPCLKPSPPARR
jgi:hypothetical protein